MTKIPDFKGGFKATWTRVHGRSCQIIGEHKANKKISQTTKIKPRTF